MDNLKKSPSEDTVEETVQTSPTLSSDTLSQSNSNEEQSSNADTAATTSPEMEKKKKKSRLSFKSINPKKLIPKRFKGEKVDDRASSEGRSEAASVVTSDGEPEGESDPANPSDLEFEPIGSTEVREKAEMEQQQQQGGKGKKKKNSSIVKRFTFGKRSKVTPTTDDVTTTTTTTTVTTTTSSTETEKTTFSSTETEDGGVQLSVSEVSLVEEDVLESVPNTLPSPTSMKKREKLLITITGKLENSSTTTTSNEGGAAERNSKVSVSSAAANDIQLPVGITTSTATAKATSAATAPIKNKDSTIISAGDYTRATTSSESILVSTNSKSSENIVQAAPQPPATGQQPTVALTTHDSNLNGIGIARGNNKPISATPSITVNSQDSAVATTVQSSSQRYTEAVSSGSETKTDVGAVVANILESQKIELRIRESFELSDSQQRKNKAKEDFMKKSSGSSSSGSGSSEKQQEQERRGSSTVRVQDSRNPYQLGNNITNPNLPGFKSPDLVVAVSPSKSSASDPAAAGDAEDKAASDIKFDIGTSVRPLKTSVASHISEVISIEGAASASDSASLDINSPGASGSSSYQRRIAYVPQATVYTPEEEEILAGKAAKSLSDEISELTFDSVTSVGSKMTPPHGDLIAENAIVSTMSASPENREHLYKILVIGELGTGKTSFIKRYVHQFFSQNYRATIGVDFALKVLNWDANTIIRLQLWDIAGQERFGNMTRVYYKEAVGAFIVFDVTRSSTFDAVVKWKQDLDSKVQLPDGSPIPCILLANKCDQTKQGPAATPGKLDEYVAKYGFAGWYETSAKENINIEDAAKALVNKILSNDKLLNPGDAGDNDVFALDGKKDPKKNSKCSC